MYILNYSYLSGMKDIESYNYVDETVNIKLYHSRCLYVEHSFANVWSPKGFATKHEPILL